MPNEYTILTLNDPQDKEPVDTWLESRVDLQARGIVGSSTRPCSSPVNASAVQVYVRAKNAVESQPAHFSARKRAIHVIPVRLIAGTTRVELFLTGTIWSQTDFVGTPGVDFSVYFKSRLGLLDRLSTAFVTAATALPVDLSFDLTGANAVTLERVEDLVVFMSSRVSTESHTAFATSLRSSPQGFERVNGDPVGVFVGADDLIRWEPNSLSESAAERGSDENANSGDSMTNTWGPSDSIILYRPRLPTGTRVSVGLFSLAGWVPTSVMIGLRTQLPALNIVSLRPNIPSFGSQTGTLNTLVERAQDTPRLLCAVPGGDELNTTDSIFEPRKWRTVSEDTDRLLFTSTLQQRRDYGQLEVQLRLLCLRGQDYETAPETAQEDVDVWEPALDNTMFRVDLWQLGALMTAEYTDTTQTYNLPGAPLKIYPMTRKSPTRFPVLRDLGRYGQGRTKSILSDISRFESGPGSRDGALLESELAMLSTLVLRVPIAGSWNPNIPVCMAVRVDPSDQTSLFTDFPFAIIACVGGSVTWSGR